MNRSEFLSRLRSALAGLPNDELEERLNFYNEMIADRMEDGISETEAVAELGTIDDLVAQITADIPLTKLVKNKIAVRKPRRPLEIVLLVLGSPVWVPLLLACFVLVLAFFAAVWAVVLAFWAVFVAIALSAVACLGAAALFFSRGEIVPGLTAVCAALVCAGLSIFLFFGCKASVKGVCILMRKTFHFVKRILIRKTNCYEMTFVKW